MGRFLACCLLVLSLAAFGQTPEKNLARLMEVYAVNANDPPLELKRKIDALLATYTDEEAFAAQGGVLKWASTNDVISPLEVSQGMLALYLRYAPEDGVAVDYWRYCTIIAARLDRGEIKRDEYDYLQGKRLALAERSDRQKYAPPPAYYQPPAEPSRVGPMLEAIGNAMRRRRPPITTTNCVTLGGVIQCQSQ